MVLAHSCDWKSSLGSHFPFSRLLPLSKSTFGLFSEVTVDPAESRHCDRHRHHHPRAVAGVVRGAVWVFGTPSTWEIHNNARRSKKNKSSFLPSKCFYIAMVTEPTREYLSALKSSLNPFHSFVIMLDKLPDIKCDTSCRKTC